MSEVLQAGVVYHDVGLANFNTLAVPAIAAYFVSVETLPQLRCALSIAKDRKLPVCVLGEGSNVVFSRDYDGLILKMGILGIKLLSEDSEHVVIRVAAGENWHGLVQHCLQQHWYGLENLALIPGLVGAAPIQNIGAYGVEVEQFIDSVALVNFSDGHEYVLSKHECQFAYRDSVFKHQLRNKSVITHVVFRLCKSPSPNLSYQGLASRVAKNATPKDVFEAVCAIRTEKLPDPAVLANSGSFFKNPIVSAAQHAALKGQFPEMFSFPYAGGFKVAAAWLIDYLGWKNRTLGKIRMHAKQALVLTNAGSQSGQDILAYAGQIQHDVERVFGLKLEIEPQII